jgi:hypothetical protein
MSESSFAAEQTFPDAVKLLEDKPPVEFGAVDTALLTRLLLMFAAPSLFFLIVFPGFGTGVMCLGAAACSLRLSRVHGEPQAVQAVLSEYKAVFTVMLIIILAAQGAAAALKGVPLLGSAATPIYVIVTLVLGGAMLLHPDRDALTATAKKAAVVPRAIVSTETLRVKRAAMDAGLTKLATLTVFSANDPTLDEAWEKKNIERIESILKRGDELTRSNWQQGISVFNSAAVDVDIARGKLRYLVTESESALAPYNIDYASIDVSKSKALEGYAPIADRKKFLTEKANYHQAVAMNTWRVTTGQMPWQIAAVAVAGIAIWHFINRSKALRLLKEMQGKIIVNAEAATGDFALIRTMLTTRVIPQFDGLLEITSHLESELMDLRSVGTDPAQVPGARDRAFRLARSLVEGKRFLEMMAGD